MDLRLHLIWPESETYRAILPLGNPYVIQEYPSDLNPFHYGLQPAMRAWLEENIPDKWAEQSIGIALHLTITGHDAAMAFKLRWG